MSRTRSVTCPELLVDHHKMNDSLSTSQNITDALPQLSVLCDYPISSQYCRLPRILLFVLLSFALMARNHTWLAAGALASALTFSGVAVIHAFILLCANGINTVDPDCNPLSRILLGTCAFTVPLSGWSESIRHLKAEPIIRAWAAFIFAGTLAIIITSGFNDLDVPRIAPASCSRAISGRYEFKTYDIRVPGDIVTAVLVPKAIWEDYNCTADCADQTPPHNILRAGQRLIPRLGTLASERSSEEGLANKIPSFYLLSAMTFMIAIAFDKSSQRIRFWMWHHLSGSSQSAPPSVVSKIRRDILKAAGFFIPFFSLGPAMFSPVILFLYMILPEFTVSGNLTESEPPSAIGQWSPWASVALVLLAALTRRYWHDVRRSLRYRFAKHHGGMVKSTWSPSTSLPQVTPSSVLKHLTQCARLNYDYLLCRFMIEYFDSLEWYRDPDAYYNKPRMPRLWFEEFRTRWRARRGLFRRAASPARRKSWDGTFGDTTTPKSQMFGSWVDRSRLVDTNGNVFIPGGYPSQYQQV